MGKKYLLKEVKKVNPNNCLEKIDIIYKLFSKKIIKIIKAQKNKIKKDNDRDFKFLIHQFKKRRTKWNNQKKSIRNKIK